MPRAARSQWTSSGSRSRTSARRGSVSAAQRAAPSWSSSRERRAQDMSTEIDPGRPVVLRGGMVLTMNDAHDVLRDADVLVVGERIAAVGPSLEVPDGTIEIDAAGGIVMPGMIDTH